MFKRKLHLSSPIMPSQFSPTGSASPSQSSPLHAVPNAILNPVPVQPFHFRSRTEPVDWRRMAALDVDRVAREVDVRVLQEFVGTVTFCSVEGERCPRCRGPPDGALINVLRMAQLSTEYLLHCQDYLSAQLCTLEERLQTALAQLQRREEEQALLEKELQEVKMENRRRKKMMSTQQLLLQASANNYHKCQFCEKSFVSYSYLQSHVQRRHPEITDAERQKKRQMEHMEDGIVELKEKLRLTQSQLAVEREAETQRRQQELEEQRRKEAVEREAIERWKEEERRRFQQEIGELRNLILQDMANRSSSVEAKLQELNSREVKSSDTQNEDDPEKQQRWMREKELREQMAQKRNEWKKKMKEVQNRYQQEKEELTSENLRLREALSVEQNTSLGLQTMKQQLLSLSSQLRQKDKLIHSQEQKIKKLSARPLSAGPPIIIPQVFKNSPEEEVENETEEEKESLPDSKEDLQKVLESLRGNAELVKDFRPILEETMEERLEKLGLRKGTKGISRQTLRSLSSLTSSQRLQSARNQPELQDLRENMQLELERRVRERQKNREKAVINTHTRQRKTPQPPVKMSPKPRPLSSKNSPRKVKTLQTPTPAPRSNTPAHSRTPQKKSSTPPFSSEEDESVEDSAYITSSRGKPSSPIHIVPSAGQQPKPTSELDWSDSDASFGSDTPKTQMVPNVSLVQTLTRSLEKNLSNPTKKPFGGVQVLPPTFQPAPRASIIKQQAVSEEESDLDLSSIEDLTPLPTAGPRSSDVAATSGTSVWSSVHSRTGGW